MGVEATTYIWQQSKQSGSKLVVMLALADYASNETGECWPGIEALAEKSRMTTRYLRTILNALEKDGEIKRIHGAGQQTDTGATNRYVLQGFVAWLKQVKAIKKENQGVNDGSGQGVNNRSPLPSQGVNNSDRRGEQEFTQGVNNRSPKSLLEPSFNRQGIEAHQIAGQIIAAYKKAYGDKAPPIIQNYDHQNAVKVAEAGYTADEVEALTREKLKEKDSYPFSWLVADLPGYRRKQPSASTYRTMSPAAPDDPNRVEVPKEEAAEFLRKAREEVEAQERANNRLDKPA